MLNLYITITASLVFIILNVVYTKYISSKPLDIKDLVYNVFLVAVSVYGSFEMIYKVLPSVGINLGSSFQGGAGKSIVNVFTNEPSF